MKEENVHGYMETKIFCDLEFVKCLCFVYLPAFFHQKFDFIVKISRSLRK